MQKILKKIEARKIRAEEQSKIAERIIDYIEQTRQLTDTQLRIYNSNARMSGDEQAWETYVGARFYADNPPLNISFIKARRKALVNEDNYFILARFAKAGDRLAIKILKFLSSKKCDEISNGFVQGSNRSWLVQYATLPAKMLKRQLTEEEYFGILNGKLSFTTAYYAGNKKYPGIQYYLPKR